MIKYQKGSIDKIQKQYKTKFIETMLMTIWFQSRLSFEI